MAQKKRGIVGYILLGLVGVGLLGFGSTSFTGSRNTVATVGDRSITVQEFYNRLRSQIDGFSRQMGVPLTFQQAQSIGLDQAVLAGLVQERALDNEIGRLGLSAGDARLRATLLSFPEFQSLDGSFDRDRYRRALQQQGTGEGAFEESIRLAIVRQLLDGAVRGASAPEDLYGRVIADWRGERRDITRLRLGAAALSDPLPDPTEAELRAQYDSDPAAYTLPEVRHITYAWLTPAMIIDSVEVDEADIQALYDSRAAEYIQPERRLVERLVYPDEAAAAAARARLDAGEAGFDALVEARGLDLADVDMGDVGPEELGAAAEAVFAAAPGDVLGPLPSPLGPALYRMNAVLAAQEVTLDEVHDDLRGELALQRAQRLIRDQSEQFIDLLAGGATIADLAASTDMEEGEIAWSDGVSDGIAAYAPFREAAAAVAEGDFPEIRELDDGGVFALQLDGIDPPALQPFDDVADRVRADWAAAATARAVQQKAEEIAATVRDGGFAALPDLAPTTDSGLRRSDFLEGGTPDLMADIFAHAEGDVWVAALPDGAIVLRLDAVRPASPEDPGVAADRAQIADEARQGIDADIRDAFATQIQLGTSVTIDQAAVNAVLAQMR